MNNKLLSDVKINKKYIRGATERINQVTQRICQKEIEKTKEEPEQKRIKGSMEKQKL